MGTIEELAQFKTECDFCLFHSVDLSLSVSLASLAQLMCIFSLASPQILGKGMFLWLWVGGLEVLIRNSVQCLTLSRSCVLWYRFPEVKVSIFPCSGKVHCSESTLPLVAIALQLSAFRGERIYSSQLTVNPLAMRSAGNSTSLWGLSHLCSWVLLCLSSSSRCIPWCTKCSPLTCTIAALAVVIKVLPTLMEAPPRHSFDRIVHAFSVDFDTVRLALGTFHAHFNSVSHQFYWCWDNGGNLWFVSSWTAAAAVFWAWPWYWFWPCLSHLGMFFRWDFS